MKTNYFFLVILTLFLTPNLNAEAPYIVFNASRGVILQSTIYGDIINPVRGTEVYIDDFFNIKDERYVVKIKDTKSGEIYSYTGKGVISSDIIVNSQTYNLAKKFFSFLSMQAEESGFNTTPVLTSQCVTQKGNNDNYSLDLTDLISNEINASINEDQYYSEVSACKVVNPDEESYYYSLFNQDTIDYAFILFTVENDGSIFKHNKIIVNESNGYRSDEIEFIPIHKGVEIVLSYFLMSIEEGIDRTCYVIIFNEKDFFQKQNNGKYIKQLDWNIIEKNLIFQGNVERVIKIVP